MWYDYTIYRDRVYKKYFITRIWINYRVCVSLYILYMYIPVRKINCKVGNLYYFLYDFGGQVGNLY